MNEDEPVLGTDDVVPKVAAAAMESRRLVDHFFRHEYARLVATLTRRFGVRHWELAEDVAQAALQRALTSWSLQGVPKNPSAWLYRVASNLAIDAIRRNARQNSLDGNIDYAAALIDSVLDVTDDVPIEDDLLRMIFVCCDPNVPSESQVALALKTLCGFSNWEIARALLTTEASVGKRIARAKTKLRRLGIEPGRLTSADFAARLPDVHAVVYLLFNEGYSSSLADRLIREELCEEAVRLALILAEQPLTAQGDSAALLALLLFHAARLEARIDATGAMLLLCEQDRSRWDRRLLNAGFKWFGRATESDSLSRYHAEAWIAAEHCRANSLDDTVWDNITRGYDLLCSIAPSPIHELNRAIAIGYRDGAQAGLAALSAIDAKGPASNYYLWHTAYAQLCQQTGDFINAKAALQQAWQLAPTNAEKELICRKLDHLLNATTESLE